MTDPRLLNRRLVLGAGGAGALGLGALALTSCSSSGDTISSATTSAGGAASASPGASTGGAAGTRLVALADVPVGGAVPASLNGKPVLVVQPTAGQAVAFSAICPHQGCTVAPAATTLACPCHGSTFTTATGALLSGPARSGLTPVAVSVVNGSVVTT